MPKINFPFSFQNEADAALFAPIWLDQLAGEFDDSQLSSCIAQRLEAGTGCRGHEGKASQLMQMDSPFESTASERKAALRYKELHAPAAFCLQGHGLLFAAHCIVAVRPVQPKPIKMNCSG